MSTMRLPAKLSPPQARNVWPRTRLFEELDGALGAHGILWIAASPGAGKSALVASYLDARRRPAVWYHIDEGDRDPATFLHHMAWAANRAAPDSAGTDLPVAADGPPGKLTPSAHHPFIQGFQGLPRGVVWVFDDWTLAPDSPAFKWIHSALGSLPEGIHVIILSRDGPPATCARMRASGSLAVLEGGLLCLTLEEAEALAGLRCHTGPKPTPELIAGLHALTGGWMTGFLLMLDGFRHNGLPLEPSALPNEQVVFDYLANEVFDCLDQGDQDVLLRIALLPQVTAEAAEAMTDHPESAAVLERLHRCLGSFVGETRRSAPVYTLSPVLRRFLRAQGRKTIPREVRCELARRAARSLSGSGQVDEAVALLAGDAEWPALADLITREGGERLARGGHETVLGWLHHVPPGVLEQDPELCYWRGAARMPADLAESRRSFERAYALFRDRGERTGMLRSWAAIVETLFFEWGDFSKLRKWITVGERLLDDATELPAGEVGWRAVGAMFIALMHGQPDHPRIGVWAQRMGDLLRHIEDDSERLLGGAPLFIYYTKWLGEHARAGVVLEMICPPPSRLARLTPMARIMYAMLKCTDHWHRYEIAAAESAIQDGIETAERCGIHAWDFLLNAQPVYAGLSGGDLAQADRYLNRMREQLPRRAPLDQAHYHYLAGWQAMLRDDPHRASEHMRHALSLVDEASGPLQHALTCIAMAQVCHALGEDQGIPALLAPARTMAQGAGSPLLFFMIAYSQASFALDVGDDAACRVALGEALALAQKHDYHNFAWCHPRVLTRLCIKALEARIEPDFVRRLIRVRAMVCETPPLHLEHWPWPLRVYTLGRFSLLQDGTPPPLNRKAQHMPVQMLKVLIALGGREVPEERLSEALWPEAEGDKAHSSFTTTLSRLRKWMGEESLVFHDGCLTLDARRCWVDAWAVQRILADVPGAADEAKAEALVQQALGLYHGPFLDSEDDAPWLRLPRERLCSRLAQAVIACARRLDAAGRRRQSRELLGKARAADPALQELLDRELAP